MQNLYSKIEGIDLKIRQVVQKIELLRKENKQVIEENTKLKKQNSQYIDNIKLLGEEIENLRNNDSQPSVQSASENTRIKKEIEDCMKEIDACIELLNN